MSTKTALHGWTLIWALALALAIAGLALPSLSAVLWRLSGSLALLGAAGAQVIEAHLFPPRRQRS